MKTFLKIIVVVIGSLAIIIGFMFIHELGHMIALYLCGYTEMEIVFLDFPWMGMKHKYVEDVNQQRFIILAGSCFAILIALPLYLYGYKKRNNVLYWGSYLSIIHNTEYWIWSIVIFKRGDGWDFIHTYENFDPYLIVIPLLFVIIAFGVVTGWQWVIRFYDYYILERYREREVSK